jgi:phosphocarrier protein
MVCKDIEITNQLGLHARAANKLVTTAIRFESTIFITKGEKKVDAKSIMSVMMLAASCGTMIRIEVDGRDEQSALDSVIELFADKFGEGQ